MLYKILFILLSVFIFLRPHFSFLHPVFSVYLGDIIIILITLFSIFFIRFKVHSSHYKLIYLSIFILITLLFPTVINSFKLNSSITIWLDYGKIFFYIITFWFLYFILLNIPERLTLSNKLIDKTFLLIAIVSVIQIFDPAILGNMIKLVYGNEKLRSIWTGYPRIYGTFYNANWFGVYLAFYLTWLNSNFITDKLALNKFISRILITIFLLIFSGSRTAVVGSAIALFFQYFSVKYIRKSIILVIIALAIFFSFLPILNQVDLLDRTLNRFISFYNVYSEAGLKISELNPGRWQTWLETYDRFTETPLFGSGNNDSIIPHNSYLYFLNLFGLISLIFLIGFSLIILLLKTNETIKSNEYLTLKKWLKGFVPAFLIMCLTADFLFTTQVMLLIIYILALLCTINSTRTIYQQDIRSRKYV